MSEIQNYVEKRKNFEDFLLDFIDNEDDSNKSFNNLIKFVNENKFFQNILELKELVSLISIIADYHYRSSNFFTKLEQILLHFDIEIKKAYSNSKPSEIFKLNQRIIYFFLEKNLIVPNESFVKYYNQSISNNIKFYLYPVMKTFLNESDSEKINKSLLDIDQDIFDNFEEKVKKGENHFHLSQLIQNDSVQEFIKYINEKNYSLTAQIQSSIFETNRFISEEGKASLIQYAAFYGSIEIFQYLRLNHVKLESSLWLYVIHGRNPELIHLLEEDRVGSNGYKNIFNIAIKCHHNEIANYINDNFLNEKQDDNYRLKYFFTECTDYFASKYMNYAFFPEDFENNDFMPFYLVNYNSMELVKLFLKDKKLNFNETIKIFNFFV